jgi:ubiquinone/menaquinone biosynthesis C-methylase UbiE
VADRPTTKGGIRKTQLFPGEAHYWDHAVHSQLRDQQALWRRFCDQLHSELISRWWPAAPVQRVLKTDLFDEVCGTGLCGPMRNRARTVVGMDVSSQMTALAVARDSRLLAASADIRRLPFAGASFDVVLSNSTLDHFVSQSEIRGGLQELHRVLQPEGRLLITLDNLTNPLIALRNTMPFRLLHKLKLVPYFVGASYGWGRFSQALEEVGFQVREQRAIMHVPRVLAIPIGKLTAAALPQAKQDLILRLFTAFERLGGWPSARFSGHFIAALAVKT